MNYQDFYEFYKVDFTENEGNKNIIGNCFFCESENGFSVSIEKGIFKCHKCGAKGNNLSFITQLADHFKELTSGEDYQALEAERGIPWRTIKAAGIAFDEQYNRWLIPFHGGGKFLSNLGVCYPFSKKLGYRILKAPGTELTLFRPFDKKSLKDSVWVFEGEWDLLAARAALKAGKIKEMPSLVCPGGSKTWTDKMHKPVQGRHLTFFWDNDKAGKEGTKFIAEKVQDCSYSFVDWNEFDPTPMKLEDIKDVRDLWTTRKERKAKAAMELFDLAESSSSRKVEASEGSDQSYDTDITTIEPIDTYEEYKQRINQDLYINESMMQTYDLVMATSLAINLPDKPVPMFVVGQASTGKTVLIEAFGGSSEWFEYISKLTATSLVSGYRDKTGKDYSLLPTLDGRTLFIGDLTVILSMPITAQAELWGKLREAFMGQYKEAYGHQETRHYKGYKFGIVAGVTHKIHSMNESDMGERFVKVDFAGDDFDEYQHMLTAMQIQDRWGEVEANLKSTILGRYKHLVDNTNFENIPTMPADLQEGMCDLAMLTTNLRTKVAKDRFEGIIAKPKPESPARFGTQLFTLAKASAWVRSEDEVTEAAYKLIRKVSIDSCPGLGLEVVQAIHKNNGLTRNGIRNKTKLPSTRVHQLVTDYQQQNLLTKKSVSNGSGNRGRNADKYYLTDRIQKALDGVFYEHKPAVKTTETKLRKKSKKRIKKRIVLKK